MGLSIVVAGRSTARCCVPVLPTGPSPVALPTGPHPVGPPARPGVWAIRVCPAPTGRVRPKGPAIPPARVVGPGGGAIPTPCRPAQRADRSTNRAGDVGNGWPVGPTNVAVWGRFTAQWAYFGPDPARWAYQSLSRHAPPAVVAFRSTSRSARSPECVRFVVARPQRAATGPRGQPFPQPGSKALEVVGDPTTSRQAQRADRSTIRVGGMVGPLGRKPC